MEVADSRSRPQIDVAHKRLHHRGSQVFAQAARIELIGTQYACYREIIDDAAAGSHFNDLRASILYDRDNTAC